LLIKRVFFKNIFHCRYLSVAGQEVYFSSLQRQMILKEILHSLIYEETSFKESIILNKRQIRLIHLLKHKIFLTAYPLHEVISS
jgi:hypothetical protein